VDYAAPRPLPSGSIPVSGQDLLPAAGALALAALACLAAIIATRGLARRLAGLVMAGLGAWIALLASEPVRAASVIAAASGPAPEAASAAATASPPAKTGAPASQAARGSQAAPATRAAPATAPAAGAERAGEPGPASGTGPRAPRPDGDAAELWEALDRG